MKQLIYIILTAIVLIFSACETIVDFPETPNIKPVPVIEALLTDRLEEHQVRFSYSAQLNDSISSYPVKNASIFVVSDKGDTITYNHTGAGVYSSPPFRANPNTVYTLIVETDTATYRASASIIALHGIDTLKIKYIPQYVNDDSAYYVQFDAGPVTEGKIKFYQVRAYRNNKEVSGESVLWLITDKFEKTLDNLRLPYAFKKDDNVVVELYSITKEMYDFYEQLDQLVITNYSSISYLENPLQMFDNYAMGYFQVSAVSSKSIVVQ